MPTVLITGAGGFVGQHLIDELRSDYKIVGLGDLKSEDEVKYFNLDIRDIDSLKKTIEEIKPEAIVHLAAISTSWSNNYEEIFSVNFGGTLNLYESIVRLKDYHPKVIYVSSADVYGKTITPENIIEDAPLFPTNFYSVSKVAADRLSYKYSQSHKMDVIIIRPFNHTGPGQKLGFFVPDMAWQIANIETGKQERIIKVGNLESIRDYLDVRDVVRAYKLILETDLKPGECFNISSGRGMAIKEVLNKLLALSIKEINVEVDAEKFRLADVPVYVGNSEKFRKITNWEPQIDLEQTLRDALDYWRSEVRS